MCGIAGVFLEKEQVAEKDLISMRDVLTHRGPDDAGVWMDQDLRLGLVHRRLSIIDLSEAAHQPMTNEDGSLVLVFNGEIYNFQDLRRDLEAKGHVFRSQSDTEVIVHAYEQWGIQAVQRFNGMFAFALYDRKQKRLFLARDRFGEKPIYFYHHDGRFLFSSELKALSAHPHFSPSLDQDVLLPYFIFGYIPYPHTIFQHTKKLPPAHYLVLNLESRKWDVKPYWDMLEQTPEVGARGENLEATIQNLDDLLSDSVRLRLIADVPVGAFLSGGVDSSLIVGIIAKLKADLKTFSIGFWDDQYDEAPYAKAVAQHLGCEHYEYYVTPEEAQDVLMKLPGIYDEPFADSSAIPTYLVSRFAREQVKVVLSGDGGDELFGGYTTYPYLACAAPLMRLPKFLRGLAGKVLGVCGGESIRRHLGLARMDELWEVFLYLNERTVAKRQDAEKIFADGRCDTLWASTFAKAFKDASGRGNIQAALYTDAKTYLVDDNLTKIDRASMAVSLEARVPFLDFRVAEFATGLSERMKMGFWGIERKRVLRTLLSKYVPREMFERPKRGFSVPLSRWLRGDLRWLLDEYLSGQRLTKEGLFDVHFVDQLVQEHLTGKRDREAILWALIFWEMWREQWGV